MKKYILGICDYEEEYLNRLQDYLNRKRSVMFSVYTFTSLNDCLEFTKAKRVDICVVEQEMLNDYKAELPFDKVFPLSENEQDGCICKYRSGEYFWERLICLCGEESLQVEGFWRIDGKTEIVGFYNPIGRCLQTSFALTLGQLLAKEHRVLYINLEPFSAFEKRMGIKYQSNLADILYYRKNLESRFVSEFDAAIQHLNGMDYLPPVFSFMDLEQVRYEDIRGLLELIVTRGKYEIILLDLSTQVNSLLEVMRLCDKVFMIAAINTLAKDKQEHFEKLITTIAYEDVLNNIKTIDLYGIGEINMKPDHLLYTPLADVARTVVKEHFGR